MKISAHGGQLNRAARIYAIVALFAVLTAPSFASDPSATIAITGTVRHPRSVTIADLQKLPQTSVPISFVTGHGQETGDYTGALLLTVLGELVDAPGRNSRLRHTIMVTGRDGYAVVLSLGEIDPDFEDKPVILATMKDGNPLDTADAIRLIVPSDRHGGKAVRDVVAIDVR